MHIISIIISYNQVTHPRYKTSRNQFICAPRMFIEASSVLAEIRNDPTVLSLNK